MKVLFQFYLWYQSHVTIVWNTRETGDIYQKNQIENLKKVDFSTSLQLATLFVV